MANSPTILSLVYALSLVTVSAADNWIELGDSPSEWTAAPKNTELGQKALSYLSDENIPWDEGNIILDSRIRYEHAAQQGLEASTSWTWRTLVGYETPRYYGFYGLAEFENTWAMNLSDYQSLPPANGRTLIREPRNNQLNQLFLGFEGYNSNFRGGRQLVKLDNGRYLSTSRWNQNDRTLDAVWVNTEVVKDFWFSYIYAWQVNNTLGVYAPDWLSRYITRDHYVNVHYKGVPYGHIGAYYYYMDLGNNPASFLGSGTSTGLFYTGEIPIDEDWSLPVRAEYAFQTENSATPSVVGDFWLNYWHFIGGANYKGYEVGVGFESIGGNGRHSYQFPTGSKHSFDGWADVFRSIPLNGLRDYYVYWIAELPSDFKVRGAFHYFTNEDNSNTFGTEIDIGLTHEFSENVSGLIEFAYYDGDDGARISRGANVTKVWISMDFHL